MAAMCDGVCGVDKVDGDNFRHADGKISVGLTCKTGDISPVLLHGNKRLAFTIWLCQFSSLK